MSLSKILENIIDTKIKKTLLKEDDLTGFNYEIPTDKRKLLYDFYMTIVLFPSGGPNSVFDNPTLEFTVNYAKDHLYTYLKEEMLNAVFFALSAEMRHYEDHDTRDHAKQILTPSEYTMFETYLDKFNNYVRNGIPPDDFVDKDKKAKKKAGTNPEDRQRQEAEALRQKQLFKGSKSEYLMSHECAESVDPERAEFVTITNKLFMQGTWRSMYGGPNWAKIAAGWLSLNKTKSNPNMQHGPRMELMRWIDAIYDLQHNTGPVLNKLYSYKDQYGSYSWLKDALDFKFKSRNPYDMFDKISYSMKELAGYALKVWKGTTLDAYLKSINSKSLDELISKKSDKSSKITHQFSTGDMVKLKPDITAEDLEAIDITSVTTQDFLLTYTYKLVSASSAYDGSWKIKLPNGDFYFVPEKMLMLSDKGQETSDEAPDWKDGDMLKFKSGVDWMKVGLGSFSDTYTPETKVEFKQFITAGEAADWTVSSKKYPDIPWVNFKSANQSHGYVAPLSYFEYDQSKYKSVSSKWQIGDKVVAVKSVATNYFHDSVYGNVGEIVDLDSDDQKLYIKFENGPKQQVTIDYADKGYIEHADKVSHPTTIKDLNNVGIEAGDMVKISDKWFNKDNNEENSHTKLLSTLKLKKGQGYKITSINHPVISDNATVTVYNPDFAKDITLGHDWWEKIESESNSPFKEGDKVIYTGTLSGDFVGKSGVVVDTKPFMSSVMVKFDDRKLGEKSALNKNLTKVADIGKKSSHKFQVGDKVTITDKTNKATKSSQYIGKSGVIHEVPNATSVYQMYTVNIKNGTEIVSVPMGVDYSDAGGLKLAREDKGLQVGTTRYYEFLSKYTEEDIFTIKVGDLVIGNAANKNDDILDHEIGRVKGITTSNYQGLKPLSKVQSSNDFLSIKWMTSSTKSPGGWSAHRFRKLVEKKDQQLTEDSMSGFNYEIPTAKDKLLYDFYATTILYPPPSSGPNAGLSDPDLEFTVNYSKAKLYTALRKELLDAVFFSLTAEIRHFFERDNAETAKRLLTPAEYDVFRKYASKLSAKKEYQIDPKKRTDSNRELTKGSSAEYRDSHKAALSADPKKQTMVELMEKLYGKGTWRSSYGGPAWEKIAHAWTKLNNVSVKGPDDLKGINEVMIWIDHVYDLQHNTDTVFNKISNYTKDGNYGWLKTALDFKRDIKSPYEMFDKITYSMKELTGFALKAWKGTDFESYVKENKSWLKTRKVTDRDPAGDPAGKYPSEPGKKSAWGDTIKMKLMDFLNKYKLKSGETFTLINHQDSAYNMLIISYTPSQLKFQKLLKNSIPVSEPAGDMAMNGVWTFLVPKKKISNSTTTSTVPTVIVAGQPTKEMSFGDYLKAYPKVVGDNFKYLNSSAELIDAAVTKLTSDSIFYQVLSVDGVVEHHFDDALEMPLDVIRRFVVSDKPDEVEKIEAEIPIPSISKELADHFIQKFKKIQKGAKYQIVGGGTHYLIQDKQFGKIVGHMGRVEKIKLGGDQFSVDLEFDDFEDYNGDPLIMDVDEHEISTQKIIIMGINDSIEAKLFVKQSKTSTKFNVGDIVKLKDEVTVDDLIAVNINRSDAKKIVDEKGNGTVERATSVRYTRVNFNAVGHVYEYMPSTLELVNTDKPKEPTDKRINPGDYIEATDKLTSAILDSWHISEKDHESILTDQLLYIAPKSNTSGWNAEVKLPKGEHYWVNLKYFRKVDGLDDWEVDSEDPQYSIGDTVEYTGENKDLAGKTGNVTKTPESNMGFVLVDFGKGPVTIFPKSLKKIGKPFTKKTRFKIGDAVEITNSYAYPSIVGKSGMIVDIDDFGNPDIKFSVPHKDFPEVMGISKHHIKKLHKPTEIETRVKKLQTYDELKGFMKGDKLYYTVDPGTKYNHAPVMVVSVNKDHIQYQYIPNPIGATESRVLPLQSSVYFTEKPKNNEPSDAFSEDLNDPKKNWKSWKNPDQFKDPGHSGANDVKKVVKRWNDLATGKTPDSNFTPANKEPLKQLNKKMQLEDYVATLDCLGEAIVNTHEFTSGGKFLGKLKRQKKSNIRGKRVDKGCRGAVSERRMTIKEQFRRARKAQIGNFKAKGKGKHGLSKVKKVMNAKINPFAT